MADESTPPAAPAADKPQPRLVGENTHWVGPKTKADLADEFNVSRNVMSEWCKKIGIATRKKLSIGQVMAFYRHYGFPGNYELKLDFE